MHRKEKTNGPFDSSKKHYSAKVVMEDFGAREETRPKGANPPLGEKKGLEPRPHWEADRQGPGEACESELRVMEQDHQERVLHIETITAMAKYQILFIKMESKLRFFARMFMRKKRGHQMDFIQRLKDIRGLRPRRKHVLTCFFADGAAKLVTVVGGAIIRRNKSFAFCRIASCSLMKGGCPAEDKKLSKLQDVLIKLETTYGKLTKGKEETSTVQPLKEPNLIDRKQLELMVHAKEEDNSLKKTKIEQLNASTEVFLDRLINRVLSTDGDKR